MTRPTTGVTLLPPAPILSRTTAVDGRLLVVVRCTGCKELHQHRAPIEGKEQTREATCGAGRYLLKDGDGDAL